MRFPIALSCLCVLARASSAGDVHLTVYTQDFAVVRDTVSLDLKPGENRVTFAEMTAYAEPDSVFLRDPAGKQTLQILEQNYRADPITHERLLSAFEGQTIDFLVERYGQEPQIVRGRIVRSGYTMNAIGRPAYMDAYGPTEICQPIVEVDGRLRLGLPGLALFPALGDDAILKPTLEWTIGSTSTARFDAELAYVTGGLGWQADYNVVAAETGDVADLVGWVTLDNRSGRTFRDAHLKLMAGDVNKLAPEQRNQFRRRQDSEGVGAGVARRVAITEKSFDDLHLYSIERPTTLRDRETKQVELVRASGVLARRLYVYDGADWSSDRGYYGRADPNLGPESNPKVWVMREIANTRANQLGMPLPKGRVRFYRRDTDGRLEFVGENTIDHTPRDETLRVYTGNAFDLVGERTRRTFQIDSAARWFDETFDIELRNHKQEAVEVRVVEHLYRWTNWEIVESSHEWTKKNAQAIEFSVPVLPDANVKVTYKVHYSW